MSKERNKSLTLTTKKSLVRKKLLGQKEVSQTENHIPVLVNICPIDIFTVLSMAISKFVVKIQIHHTQTKCFVEMSCRSIIAC